jgi:amidase
LTRFADNAKLFMTNSSTPVAVPADPLGAFCRDNHCTLEGAPAGVLAGLTFGAKDVFDVAGARTGFGQPDWLRTHEPATETAEAISRLTAAGATMIGKTITDELTYSLAGTNAHYGAPINARAPDRASGGSSSGSAAAVAGELCDFAIGTDCGGSVRTPASYCGVLGIRPSHGRVSLAGVVPFAGSFDVAGWFARTPQLFERLGSVLLEPASGAPARPGKLVVLRDGFHLLDQNSRVLADAALARVASHFAHRSEARLPEAIGDRVGVFQTIQAHEIWANHSEWIRRVNPTFGPGVKERFEAASRITDDERDQAAARRTTIAEAVDALFADDAVICMPTVPRVAPLQATPTYADELKSRADAMSLLCIAGLCGLPQVSLPLIDVDGLPLGVSLMGKWGSDENLLAISRSIMDGGA